MLKFSKISSWKLFILSIFFSGLLTACDGLQDLNLIVQPEQNINDIGVRVAGPNISTSLVDTAINSVDDTVLGRARAIATRMAVDRNGEINQQSEPTARRVMATPSPRVVAEQEAQIEKRISKLHDLEDRLRNKGLLPDELSFFDPKTDFPADYIAELELDRSGNPVTRPMTVDVDRQRTVVQAIMIPVSTAGNPDTVRQLMERASTKGANSQIVLGAVIINQARRGQDIPLGLYAVVGDFSLDQVFLLDENLGSVSMAPIPLIRSEKSSMRNSSDQMAGSDITTYYHFEWDGGCWCLNHFDYAVYHVASYLAWIQCHPNN